MNKIIFPMEDYMGMNVVRTVYYFERTVYYFERTVYLYHSCERYIIRANDITFDSAANLTRFIPFSRLGASDLVMNTEVEMFILSVLKIQAMFNKSCLPLTVDCSAHVQWLFLPQWPSRPTWREMRE